MISLRFLPLLSLTGLIVLSAIVLGQETDVTDISAGITPAPTATSGPVIVLCNIPEVDPQINETIAMPENLSNIPALPTGVECYSVLTNGLPDSTPFTTIGILGVTDLPRTTNISSSVPTDGSLSSGSSDSSNLKVVLPAVLGSVVVACLLVVGLLWLRRSRKRTATRRQSMRAWVQRPGGWMGDKEEPHNDIALHERQPRQV